MKEYTAVCTISFTVEAENENEAYMKAKGYFKNALYPDFIDLEEDDEDDEDE